MRAVRLVPRGELAAAAQGVPRVHAGNADDGHAFEPSPNSIVPPVAVRTQRADESLW